MICKAAAQKRNSGRWDPQIAINGILLKEVARSSIKISDVIPDKKLFCFLIVYLTCYILFLRAYTKIWR